MPMIKVPVYASDESRKSWQECSVDAARSYVMRRLNEDLHDSNGTPLTRAQKVRYIDEHLLRGCTVDELMGVRR